MKLMIYFSAAGIPDKGHYKTKMALRRAVEATLCHEGFDRDAEISVTITDNEGIRGTNAEFRQKDMPTDVLSFPMYEQEELQASDDPSLCLGDIVISLERANEQARELGHSYLREVSFLAIHSTLHLLGMDHERSHEEEEAMCAKQRAIIAKLYPEEGKEED